MDFDRLLEEGRRKTDTGEYDQALQIFEKTLKEVKNLIRSANQKEIDIFNEIGKIYLYQGKFDKALATTDLSLTKSRELDYKEGIAHALNIQGNAHLTKGGHEQALKDYQESLDIYQAHNNKLKAAGILNNIANVYLAQGNPEKALSLYSKGLETVRKLGEKKRIADFLNNIGIIYSQWGEYDKALTLHQEQLKIDEEIDYKYGTSIALSNIASIHLSKGEYDQAETFLRRSLKIDQETGDREGEAENYLQLGRMYWSKEDIEQAFEFLQQAKMKLNQMGLKTANLVEVLAELVGVNTDLKSFTEAEKLLIEIQNLIETIDSSLPKTIYLFYKGYLEQGKHNLASAKKAFLAALQEAQQTKQIEYVIRSLIELASLSLSSYRASFEQEHLEDLKRFIGEAQDLASSKNLYNVVCETRLLQALLHATHFDFDTAIKILEQVMFIAENKHLEQQQNRIQQAMEGILDQKKKFNRLGETQSPTERMGRMQAYIRDCQKLLKTLKVS
ncbi:MAG: tetratricopeptide repeat protein [Candidatus Hodarchaeota archaeon]